MAVTKRILFVCSVCLYQTPTLSQPLFWASRSSTEQTRRGAGRGCDRGHGVAGRGGWGEGYPVDSEEDPGRGLRWDRGTVGKLKSARGWGGFISEGSVGVGVGGGEGGPWQE